MVMIFDHNDEEDVCVQQGINENMVKNDGNLFQNLYFFYVAKKEIQSRKFTESLSIYHSEFCLSWFPCSQGKIARNSFCHILPYFYKYPDVCKRY